MSESVFGGSGTTSRAPSAVFGQSHRTPSMRKKLQTVRVRMAPSSDDDNDASVQPKVAASDGQRVLAGQGVGGRTLKGVGAMTQRQLQQSMRLPHWAGLNPPEGLPDLHQAVFDGDEQLVRKILDGMKGQPLGDLIWWNSQFYPSHPRPDRGGTAEDECIHIDNDDGDDDEDGMMPSAPLRSAPTSARSTRSTRSAVPPVRASASALAMANVFGPLSVVSHKPPADANIPPTYRPPEEATLESATKAVRSLLNGYYLYHACHPLTIAAAQGDVPCVEALLGFITKQSKQDVMHCITWDRPPTCLPPGCPWVTPLGAAALYGSGECVTKIAIAIKAIHRSGSLVTHDKSCWGAFVRIKPVVVAQSADAVRALHAKGCAATDLSKICGWATRLANERQPGHQHRHSSRRLAGGRPLLLPGGGSGGAGHPVTWAASASAADAEPGSALAPPPPAATTLTTQVLAGAAQPSTQPPPQGLQQHQHQPLHSSGSGIDQASGSGDGSVPRAQRQAGGGGDAAPPDAPPVTGMTSAFSAMAMGPGGPGPGRGPSGSLTPGANFAMLSSVVHTANRYATLHHAGPRQQQVPGAAAPMDEASYYASEVLLLRARMFLDHAGDHLADSLPKYKANTQTALLALTALVEYGLQPDLFMSYPSRPGAPAETSTTLMSLVLAHYDTAQAYASRAANAAGRGAKRATTGRMGSLHADFALSSHANHAGSVSTGHGSAQEAADAALHAGSDLGAQAQETLGGLLQMLLAKGANVDKLALNPNCPGGVVMPIEGVGAGKAPIDYAFENGPQEVVAALLRKSQRRPRKQCLHKWGGSDEKNQDGADDGGSGSLVRFAPERPVSAASSTADGTWRGGSSSSPLLAFGAKIQEYILAGETLPEWLQECKPDLMADLISATIQAYPTQATSDLIWLITFFEDCVQLPLSQHVAENSLETIVAELTQAAEGGRNGHGQSGREGLLAAPTARRSQAPQPAYPLLLQPQTSAASPLGRVMGLGGSGKAHAGGDSIPRAAPAAVHFRSASHLGRGAAVAEAVLHERQQGDIETPAWGTELPGSVPNAAAIQQQHYQTQQHGLGVRGLSGDRGSVLGHHLAAGNRDGKAGAAGSTKGGRKVTILGDVEVHHDEDNSDNDSRDAGRDDAGDMLAKFEGNMRKAQVITCLNNLYRFVAEAVTEVHQEWKESKVPGAVAAAAVAAVGRVVQAADLVTWNDMLRIVARIAAFTLTHGSSSDISVFIATKAVTQLLYARDWALDLPASGSSGSDSFHHYTTGGMSNLTAGAGAGTSSTVVDLKLLNTIAQRYPHEAARLIHGMDLMRMPLEDDAVPLNLRPNFTAVLTCGPAIRMSSTVSQAMGDGVANEDEDDPTSIGRASQAPSMFIGAMSGGDLALAVDPDAGGLGRWDLLQACIFTSMWSVLLHFLLVSVRLPGYMPALERRRRGAYWFAALAYVCQFGSIPMAILLGLVGLVVGAVARLLLGALRLVGHVLFRFFTHAAARIGGRAATDPSTVGKPAARGNTLKQNVSEKLRPDRGRHGVKQKFMGTVNKGLTRITREATGLHTFTSMRVIPKLAATLGVLYNKDALAELWLGVTQRLTRNAQRAKDSRSGRGPALSLTGTTRIVCSRVPIPCAAAMPATLLYKLASSPQVNGELFASPVMRAIVAFRWQHFTRYFLLLQMLDHIMYTGVFIVYSFSLSRDHGLLFDGICRFKLASVSGSHCTLAPTCLQHILLWVLAVFTLTCVVQELRQLAFFGIFWFKQPWNMLDAASSAIMSTIIVLHFNCRASQGWLRGLAAVEIVLLFVRLLYFAMADDRLGSFFRMVIEVIKDLSLFFVFLGVIFLGFGLALTVMQGDAGDTMRNTFMQLFTSIFGDFQLPLLQNANAGSDGLDSLYRAFISFYQIIVVILLLNLLIAIINDSYERVNDNEVSESLRNKVTLIVEAESVLPNSLYRNMLEQLARRDLYVIKPESATQAGIEDEDAAENTTGGPKRTLAPPSRWSGRVGETKRYVTSLVDQLNAQQQSFQRRIIVLLQGIKEGAGGSAVKGSSLGGDGSGGGSRRGRGSQHGGGAGGRSGVLAARSGSIGPGGLGSMTSASGGLLGFGAKGDDDDDILETVETIKQHGEVALRALDAVQHNQGVILEVLEELASRPTWAPAAQQQQLQQSSRAQSTSQKQTSFSSQQLALGQRQPPPASRSGTLSAAAASPHDAVAAAGGVDADLLTRVAEQAAAAAVAQLMARLQAAPAGVQAAAWLAAQAAGTAGEPPAAAARPADAAPKPSPR